jgi:hypothetical protein
MKSLKLYHKILLLSFVLLIAFGMWYFKTGCLVQKFFNIPCLTCGMTRAFFAFINGNVALSFEIHPMLISIPMLTVMFLFSDSLFNGKVKKYSVTLLILIVSGFIFNYFRNF